jgi:hypothetical protein
MAEWALEVQISPNFFANLLVCFLFEHAAEVGNIDLRLGPVSFVATDQGLDLPDELRRLLVLGVVGDVHKNDFVEDVAARVMRCLVIAEVVVY